MRQTTLIDKNYNLLQKKNILLFVFILFTILFAFCGTEKQIHQVEKEAYLNWNDTVQYVGSQLCGSCHAEQYETFMRTGMGQSFHFATKEKTAATFDHNALVFDTTNNFYYLPYFAKDSMFIKEFRLAENGDTTHKHTEKVAFIVGSGQHTNSHIYECNGFLRQAPITFYTQKGIWDMAPGFEGGFSSGFNRIIGHECMSCHNSYPDFVKTSENKFRDIPLGIGCERCHGPGSEHVKLIGEGQRIDTSKYIDYSIVNPGKLEKDLQMSICQRCHIQGVSVLAEGKDYDSFQPGKPITETMKVFLPKYSGAQTKFIMASHADRTAMSECYKKSEMTCISCHNPHVSVKETPESKFITACQNCHQANNEAHLKCTADEKDLKAEDNNCITCHMPVSPSIDIPNVTIHDHYIRKPITEAQKNEVEEFIGLRCVTGNEKVSNLEFSKAYLSYFESFTSDPSALDSAAYYIQKISNSHQKAEQNIRLFYLQNDYPKIIEASKKLEEKKVKDAWTFYRIGEAYYQNSSFEQAAEMYLKAKKIKPYQLDFQNKLASAYSALGKWQEAQKIFEFIVEEDPKHVSALNNLGYVYFSFGEIEKAENLYEKAINLNPDYIPALLNKVGLLLYNKDKIAAKKLINRLIQQFPDNPKIQLLRKQVIL